jgi:hypothetical protein
LCHPKLSWFKQRNNYQFDGITSIVGCKYILNYNDDDWKYILAH